MEPQLDPAEAAALALKSLTFRWPRWHAHRAGPRCQHRRPDRRHRRLHAGGAHQGEFCAAAPAAQPSRGQQALPDRGPERRDRRVGTAPARPALQRVPGRPQDGQPSGALNEIEYSEFVQKFQAFADAIQADAQFPDMLDVVAHARELDQFAAAHDAQLALLLRATPPGRPASSTRWHCATASCRPAAGPLVLPSPDEGAPPILTLNFDPRPRWPRTRGPVPARTDVGARRAQTPAEQSPLPPGRDSARLLARDLEADMCDDQRPPAGPARLCRHRHRAEEALRDFGGARPAAGSAAARRLFS